MTTEVKREPVPAGLDMEAPFYIIAWEKGLMDDLEGILGLYVDMITRGRVLVKPVHLRELEAWQRVLRDYDCVLIPEVL